MPSMNPDAFNLGASSLTRKPSKEHVEAVKRYLVDGESPTEIAREYQITRQWLYKLARKIRQAAIDNDELPPGYEKVEVVVPKRYVRLVRAIEREAKEVEDDENVSDN